MIPGYSSRGFPIGEDCLNTVEEASSLLSNERTLVTRGYVTAQAKLLNLPWNPTGRGGGGEEGGERGNRVEKWRNLKRFELILTTKLRIFSSIPF